MTVSIDSSPGSERFERFLHDTENPTSISQNRINAILADSRGDIWVGTYDGGLNRYDAETGEFERFVHDPADSTSLASQATKVLFEDSRQRMWVGTWSGGVDQFDRERGIFLHNRHDPARKESLSDDRVYAIAEDAAGQIWVGTQLGANRYDPRHAAFARYQHEPAKPEQSPCQPGPVGPRG